jgi:four helix bundle protein
MSDIKTFEDLDCWKYGRELTVLVYKATKSAMQERDFGFADQMRRAAISVMNNIAEGFERDSNVDYARFLYIAKASAGEVRSMAYAGLDLGYFTQPQFDQLFQLSTRCSKTTWGLIKSVTKKSSWRTKVGIFIALLFVPLTTLNLQP